MAIALDTAGGAYARSASSTSSNHTFANTAGTMLVAGFATNDAADEVTSVTYNGVGLTRGIDVAATGEHDYLYYLDSPSTGSNTLTVNRSSARVCDVGIASYTGVASSSPVDQTNTNTIASGASATITETITPTVSNTWMIAWSGLQRVSTAGTNSTNRSGVAVGGALYDSNGTLTSGVGFTMTQNISGNGPAGGVAMNLKEAVGVVVANNHNNLCLLGVS